MTYRPAMEWTKGGMPTVDKYLNLALVRAPYQQVLNAVGGVLRAVDGSVYVTEGVTEPPMVRNDQIRRQKPKDLSDFEGYLVSRLGPDLSLVEMPSYRRIAMPLTLLIPHAEVFEMLSEMENAKHQWHGFMVWKDGQRLRSVQSDGWGRAAWEYDEHGSRGAWEPGALEKDLSPAQRCNRAVLLSYAQAYGLDVERVLFKRELDTPVLLETGDPHMKKYDDTRIRTQMFETEYQQALALGIGELHDTLVEDDMLTYLRHMQDHRKIRDRAYKALNRRPDTLEKITKIYETYLLDANAVSPAHDPNDVLELALNSARRVAPSARLVENLESECRHRKEISTLVFQIQASIPDEVLDKVPGWLPATFGPLRGRAYDLVVAGQSCEAAVRSAFAQFFEGHGLDWRPSDLLEEDGEDFSGYSDLMPKDDGAFDPTHGMFWEVPERVLENWKSEK